MSQVRRNRKPVFGTPAYRQMWRIVDGAVTDALTHHPDYLTAKGTRAARISVVKRVTGAVLSFAEASAKGRPRSSRAADTASMVFSSTTRTAEDHSGPLDLPRWQGGWVCVRPGRPIQSISAED